VVLHEPTDAKQNRGDGRPRTYPQVQLPHQPVHPQPIVVDFGTATTFDCIPGDGRFIGGVIMPGIRTGVGRPRGRTAKLPPRS